MADTNNARAALMRLRDLFYSAASDTNLSDDMREAYRSAWRDVRNAIGSVPDDRDALRASLESLVRAVKRRRHVKQARHLEWLRASDEEAEALALSEKVLKP